jgi:hypothetical protein
MEQFGITERQLREEFTLEMVKKVGEFNKLRRSKEEVDAKHNKAISKWQT